MWPAAEDDARDSTAHDITNMYPWHLHCDLVCTLKKGTYRKCQVIKDLCAPPPCIRVPVFALALVIESIHLIIYKLVRNQRRVAVDDQA